jgi:hypothetical protein
MTVREAIHSLDETKPQRMAFRPQHSASKHLWDVWLQVENETYYCYYLASGDDSAVRGFDNTALAISKDGVSWVDRGPVVELSAGGVSMGSAGVWPSMGVGGLPRFIMNLQETRIAEGRVMFALGSDDLIDWRALGDAYTFGSDARWYQPDDRWVGISVIPHADGGYYGYWTGTPRDDVEGLFGFGRSADGAAWEVLAPPDVEGLGRGWLQEVGGVAVIDGKVWLLMCVYQGEMTVLTADRPKGPFRTQSKNRRLLFGQTHFARFAGGETDEPLVVHHVLATADLDAPPISYLAPIKRARVDDEGILRLAYWAGNDRLKDRPVDVLYREEAVGRDERLVMLGNRFNVDRGVILEGQFTGLEPERFLALNQGVYVETSPGRGVGLMLSPSGAVQIGTMRGDGTGFRMTSFINRQRVFGLSPRFRLMLRERVVELYVEDDLVQCYALPGVATGRLGVVHNGDPGSVGSLKAWN